MNSLGTTRSHNARIAVQAAKEGRIPYVFWDKAEVDEISNFVTLLPLLGTYVPEGWTPLTSLVLSTAATQMELTGIRAFIKGSISRFVPDTVGFALTGSTGRTATLRVYTKPADPRPLEEGEDARFQNWSRQQLIDKILELENEVETARVAHEDAGLERYFYGE